MGTTFIDSAAHPIAVSYYEKVKGEPIQSGPHGSIWERFERAPVALPHMSLRKLLASMIGSVAPGFNAGGLTYPGDSVLICCHGTKTQLSIPVDSGGANVYADSIKLLEACLKLRSDDKTAPATLADYAGRMRVSVSSLKNLLQDLKKVQALNIGHVAFRACNIGNTPTLLAALKRLFNAGSVSAPDVFDGYNNVNPRVAKDAKAFEKHLKAHPQALVSGAAPHRMAITTSAGSSSGKWRIDELAESELAVHYWYVSKYPLSALTPKVGSKFPIHAMVLDKTSYGVVFPGDREYMSHLVYWSRSEASYLD